MEPVSAMQLTVWPLTMLMSELAAMQDKETPPRK